MTRWRQVDGDTLATGLFAALAVIGLVVLLVSSVLGWKGSTLAAGRSLKAAEAATAAADAARAQSQQTARLVDQLNAQNAQLRVLVDDANRSAARAAADAAAGEKIIAGIDRTLNALCQVDACGAPPLTFAAGGSPAGGQNGAQASTTTTAPGRPKPPKPKNPDHRPPPTTSPLTIPTLPTIPARL